MPNYIILLSGGHSCPLISVLVLGVLYVRGISLTPNGSSQSRLSLCDTSLKYIEHIERVEQKICHKADLFVGGAKFTFPRPVFLDQSGAYFEASSKFSIGIFNTLWSFMCHRATYFEKFLICFFEAFSNWKGLQHG